MAEETPLSADAAAGAAVVVEAPVGRRIVDVQAAFAARDEALRRLNSTRASQNAGTIVASFVVAPSGQIVECRLVSSDFQDPAFNAAVFAEVWRLYLGEQNVGDWAVRDYPIEFSAREPLLTPAATGSAPPPGAPLRPNAAPAG